MHALRDVLEGLTQDFMARSVAKDATSVDGAPAKVNAGNTAALFMQTFSTPFLKFREACSQLS